MPEPQEYFSFSCQAPPVRIISHPGHISNPVRILKTAKVIIPTGAGPVMTPRLIAAMGTDRDRYASAEEIQRRSGIAPLIESSGRQYWIHWRWSCSKFLRQTFHEWASHSLAYSGWAREYYQAQREQNKGHHAAVRALAFKWIRILFRCWKDRTPYDEGVYLRALANRQPRPPANSHPPSGPQPKFIWTSRAGFNKLIGFEY
jgi:Transposase IS116/IS110/IS902 family